MDERKLRMDSTPVVPVLQRQMSACESLLGSFMAMRRNSRTGSIHAVSETTSVIGSEELLLVRQGKSGCSWWSGVITMANCTIGMGLLNFPKAFSNAGGIKNALVIELVCLVLIIVSLWILGTCCQRYGDVSYQGMVTTHCGNFAGNVCKLFIFLNNLGACIVLLVVIGDQFDRLMVLIDGVHFCHKWYLTRQFLVPVAATVLVLPACLLQRFELFKYTSFLGVLAAVYISFVVTLTRYFTGVDVYGQTALSNSSIAKKQTRISTEIFKVIPLVCFAYECHIEAPPMLANLRSKRMTYFLKMVIGYVVLSFTVYTVAATFGYLTFEDSVTSDLLLSYGSRDPLVIVAMAFICVKVFCTYPVMFFCVRTVVDDIWRKHIQFLVSHEFGRRLLQTVSLFYLTVAISVFVPTISDAIAFIGCLSATFVFIFPGLCFMNMNLTSGRDVMSKIYLCLAVAFVVLGTFLAGAICTMSIADYLLSSDNRKEPSLCQ